MITDKKHRLKLVLVTKGRSVLEIERLIEEAHQRGIRSIRLAENRLEEASEKWPAIQTPFEKHFIGKLQSRKIAKIVALFDVIQSVENLEQAQKISAACEEQAKIMRVFLQVNLSKLPQRSGVDPQEALQLISKLKTLPHLELQGLMGIASMDPFLARQEFRTLKALQGNLEECSMGMSEDYSIAVEEGSTLLRLGRVLFEEGLPKELDFE